MRHRIFLPLFLVLSATAFSASAMAASDTKAPPANSNNSSTFPPFPSPYIHENDEWCKHYPSTIMKPEYFCQICQC
ncbi:PagK family vesicle-borne virulence factor [Salmonella enterica subsp. enterica]